MTDSIFSRGISCPKCCGESVHYNIECDSCYEGFIPIRTLKFISDNLSEEQNFYRCNYKYILNSNKKVEINFLISKENFEVLELNYSSSGKIELPRNTVKIIDKLISEFSEGEYQ